MQIKNIRRVTNKFDVKRNVLDVNWQRMSPIFAAKSVPTSNHYPAGCGLPGPLSAAQLRVSGGSVCVAGSPFGLPQDSRNAPHQRPYGAKPESPSSRWARRTRQHRASLRHHRSSAPPPRTGKLWVCRRGARLFLLSWKLWELTSRLENLFSRFSSKNVWCAICAKYLCRLL